MEKRTLNEAMKILKLRNSIRESINRKLSFYNFENIEPSFFEKYDSFNQFHGRIQKEKTVKVINNRGEIEILRPDITLNIIKNVSKLWDEKCHLKLSYDSTVFKNDTDLGIVETRQIGAESLGCISIDSDIEILTIAKELLENLDKGVLVIGNTKYLKGLISEIKCEDEKKDEITNAVYKKNIGELNEILDYLDVESEIKEKIVMLIQLDDFDKEKLTSGFINSEMREAIREIEFIKTKISGTKKLSITFDLGLVSEFDYYDGVIFKGFHPNLNQCFIKGGRYDKLSKLFDKNIPAVGFSMDLDEYYKVVGGQND